jgi:NADPH:quinone reductase-like Zn-dependent oxidoreductase
MKTMQIDRFGGPEVLHAAEAPEPHAGQGQVRVRVRAVGVNRFDAALRSGALQAMFPRPLPAVPGLELAGVVDEVGAGVSELAVGDEIFGLSNGGAYAELAVATVVA